jgi:hypothetical protein
MRVTEVNITEFNNIFRLVLNERYFLDVYEVDAREKNYFNNFRLSMTPFNDNYVTMNGKVIDVKNDNVYVSFGGLLGRFPKSSKNVNDDFVVYYSVD